MIIYESTIKELWNDFQLPNNVVPRKLREILLKDGQKYAASGEWESWATTLYDFVGKVAVNEQMHDLNIILEYKIVATGNRIDATISGKKDGKKYMFIIEIKGWNTAKISKNNTIDANTSYSGYSHPSSQILRYKRGIEEFTNLVSEHNFIIEAMVVLPNYDVSNKYILWHPQFDKYNKNIYTFDKGNIDLLSNSILNKIDKPLNDEEMNQIKNAKRVAKKILLEEEDITMFNLSYEQNEVVNRIFELAAQANNTNKKVLIVKGAPGCGKTLVAVKSLIRLTNELGLRCDALIPGSEFLLALRNTWSDKGWQTNMVGLNNKETWFKERQTDVWIFDEAHKATKSRNSVYSIIQRGYNNSRLIVLFIDDYQKVRINGITSNELKTNLTNEKIEYEEMELNASFRQMDYSYGDWLKNWIYNETKNNDEIQFRQDYYVNNSEFSVHVHSEESNFIESYLKSYDSTNARIMSLWFLYPDFNIKLDKNNELIRPIKLGKHHFHWNINRNFIRNNKGLPKHIVNLQAKSFNEPKGKDKFMIGYYSDVQGSEYDKGYVYIPKFVKWNDVKKEIEFDIKHYFTNKDEKHKIKHNGFRESVKEPNWLEENVLLLKNRLYILLTRATKETHIYCEDKNLNDHLKKLVLDN